MKISKFHELLHIVRDIHLFGPPKGYDGRPGEGSHKQTKQLAKRTQKRTDYTATKKSLIFTLKKNIEKL